jgi:CxC2 like cysteine cluster associated with KDZ transposases
MTNIEVDSDGDAKMEEETDSGDENNTGSKLVYIVHSTGVYQRSIRYCKCQHSLDPPIQLLQLHLFPSTFKNPATIFTFDVLDHFYIDAMECKTSAGSFFTKLRRLTSNAFPEQVPVSEIEI